MKTSTLLFCLVAVSLPGQVKPGLPTLPKDQPTQGNDAAPARSIRPLLTLRAPLKGNLLPVGKTQGNFHLTGLVRRNREVLLRWSNSEGEMPTEGVWIYRQKDGDTTWKDITPRKPIGFLQGRAAEKRLAALPAEDRDKLLAYPFGDVAHDPVTRLRLPGLKQAPPKGQPRRAEDLTAEGSLAQFRTLRGLGKLNRDDLKLMHMRADADSGMAELLGLTFTDDPGKGVFRYKIVVKLPEGGSVDVPCPKAFDTREPTIIPQPTTLTAASGNGEVLLNWDETPNDVVGGYNIYRSEQPDGPWKLRLNTDPVKRVELELEDPELTLRRSMGIQDAMTRMLRPLPEAARTPQKVVEAHQAALTQMATPANLPTLSPAQSKALKDAVSTGRVRPGGRQAPASVFTDTIRAAGSTLQTEKTYYYKVTAVDIGGQEQPLDTAPVVAGIPKDLEPPRVPGQPHLKAERLALTGLRQAHALRLKEPRLAAAETALAARMPRASQPLTPAQLAAPMAGPALQPVTSPSAVTLSTLSPGSQNVADLRREKLSRMVATMPVSELQKVAKASVLRSTPEGAVPPAQLTWDPSPDADLKGYEVHKAMGNGTFAKVAETPMPEWTDTDLQPGQAYRYAIAAVDRLGNVSARSPEQKVEVEDGSLPGRLAVPQLAGQVVKELPAQLQVRRLIRPPGRILASGALRKPTPGKVNLQRTSEPVVSTFQAPKATVAPKVTFAPLASVSVVEGKGTAPAAKPAATVRPGLSKTLSATATEVKIGDLATTLKPITRITPRSLNLMLAQAGPAKELHVSLTWARPIQGMPMEYVIQQAPQRSEVVSVKRPEVVFQPTFRAFEALQARPALTAVQPANRPQVALNAAPATFASATFASAPAASAGKPEASGLLVSNAARHALAASGKVALAGGGLRLAEARQDFRASVVRQAGPGTFARVNEAPVATESYGISFPAEVAQYGGATFYFRIQAATREFGRRVEGALSDPVEVRLPDIVPPPPPVPGAVDLQEGPGGRLDVALGWTQTGTPDFKGVLVDRQPYTYTLVDGEAKAGEPKGPAKRLTEAPVSGKAWKDTEAGGGYFRYTLRSVDQTGNISEPMGHLDILVPGEPVPAAPTGLTVAGALLTWKAGADTAGFTVWRSFTGTEDDWDCISGILGADQGQFTLPAEGALHLKVVARSASGMHATASTTILRTP